MKIIYAPSMLKTLSSKEMINSEQHVTVKNNIYTHKNAEVLPTCHLFLT